jgi:membrane-anchored glycerophosphoryl diester phosphodiesterase (GDPDase)
MHISEYDFDVMKVIKEGFRRIEGIKQPFLLAFAVYIIVAIVTQLFLGLFFPSSPEHPNVINQQIVAILSYPVLMPLLTGIMMMAIKHSREEKDALELRSIFDYYKLTGKLSFASLFIYLFTVFIPMIMIMLFPGTIVQFAGAGTGAFLVLILAAIIFLSISVYLSIAYIFTLPLIADKGLHVWEAMELSRKTVAKRWGKFAWVVTILSLAGIAGLLTFGIGLIWAIPFFFVTLYGLLYVMIFDDVEEV